MNVMNNFEHIQSINIWQTQLLQSRQKNGCSFEQKLGQINEQGDKKADSKKKWLP